MPAQPTSQLQRLVQRDCRNDPPPDALVRPAASSSIDDADDPSNNANKPEAVQTEEDVVYNEQDWARVLHLERRAKEHVK
jgi:hypothetical protein